MTRNRFAYLLCAAAALLLLGNPARCDAKVIYVSTGHLVSAYDGETGAAVPGFTSPTSTGYPSGLVVSGGDLFLASQDASGNNNKIAEYDATTGTAVPGFTAIAAGAGRGFLDVAVSGGNIYATEFGSPFLLVAYSATTGAPVTGFTPSGNTEPISIAVSDGVVYAPDDYTGKMDEFDASTGATIRTFTLTQFTHRSGTGPGEMSVTVSGSDLYVSDGYGNAITEYDATTGNVIAAFASPAGLSEPEGLVISGNDLYVADAANNEVKAYDATTGAAIAGFTPPAGLAHPLYIAVSPVPESASWLLFGLAGGVFYGGRRFRSFYRAGRQLVAGSADFRNHI